MTDGGLDLFSTIRFVDTGEIVAVEDFDFELGDLWEGVELNTERDAGRVARRDVVHSSSSL